MRNIFILALKDIRVANRYKLVAFFHFVFPVLYAILVGYMMSGIVGLGVGMYRGTVSVAVADQDQSEFSAGFLRQLQAAKELKIHQVDFDTAKDMVRRRRCAAHLVLHKGFGSTSWLLTPGGQPRMRLVIDEARIAEGQIVRGMVYMQLMDYVRSHFLRSFTDNPEQNARLRAVFRAYLDVDTQLDSALKQQLIDLLHTWQSVEQTQSTSGGQPPSGPTLATESGRFKDNSILRQIFPITFPQGMIWAMLFSAAFYAISLVEERAEGTLQRLRMAPLTRLQLLLGKGLACMMNCLGTSIALLAVGMLFFGIRSNSYVLLLIGLLSAALSFSGMMMLLASLSKTPAAAEGVSLSALLIMAMLGGAMVPEVVMPPFARTISSYVPIKWAIMAMEGPIRRDFSLGEMAPYCVGLTLLGMACYVVGVFVFRLTED